MSEENKWKYEYGEIRNFGDKPYETHRFWKSKKYMDVYDVEIYLNQMEDDIRYLLGNNHNWERDLEIQDRYGRH